MAVNNEYANKVDVDGQTIIDLTDDTVAEDDVLEGQTFHLRSGAPAVGTYRPSDEIEARLEATVGHSNKNLLPITLESRPYDTDGNDFRVTVDKVGGTITINGTSKSSGATNIEFYTDTNGKLSGNFYITGGVTGCVVRAYDYDSQDANKWAKKWDGTTTASGSSSEHDSQEVQAVAGHKFGYRLRVSAGQSFTNAVIKPMLRDSSIDDDSFEPYTTPTDMLIETKTRAYLNSSVGHSSKNLFEIILSRTSITTSGATFTANIADGTVTLTGTATTDAQLNIQGDERRPIVTGILKNGQILTCDGIINGTDFGINYYNENGTYISTQRIDATISARVVEIPTNAVFYRFFLRKLPASGNSSTTVYPMLRDGSIKDNTFEPYVIPTDEKKQDKPVVLWEGDATTNLTISVGDNSYYSYYILTGVSDVKTDPSAEALVPAIFTVIIHSDMPGSYCAPFYDVYAILTVSYQSSQGATNIVIDIPRYLTLKKIVGVPK